MLFGKLAAILSRRQCVNKMADILQTMLSSAFSWKNMFDNRREK